MVDPTQPSLSFYAATEGYHRIVAVSDILLSRSSYDKASRQQNFSFSPEPQGHALYGFKSNSSQWLARIARLRFRQPAIQTSEFLKSPNTAGASLAILPRGSKSPES
jgi:hypothetical protein